MIFTFLWIFTTLRHFNKAWGLSDPYILACHICRLLGTCDSYRQHWSCLLLSPLSSPGQMSLNLSKSEMFCQLSSIRVKYLPLTIGLGACQRSLIFYLKGLGIRRWKETFNCLWGLLTIHVLLCWSCCKRAINMMQRTRFLSRMISAAAVKYVSVCINFQTKYWMLL